MKKLKILVACEFSGIVRDAFIKKGHDVISCDLLPTESPGPHYQGDVMDIINDGFDMMVAHPPCTYLSYAGTMYWNEKGRCEKRLEALEFFRKLWESPINKICIENPKGCASPTIAKYSQVIQPYYFGDSAIKTTWLWLKNLPLLQYNIENDLFFNKTSIEKPEPIYIDKKGKKRHFVDSLGRNKDRQKIRSQFWLGIADAMSTQWS